MTGNIQVMKPPVRVYGDAARYYRSRQGQGALATAAVAIAGVVSGSKTIGVAAILMFGKFILPRNVVDLWQQAESQEAIRQALAHQASDKGHPTSATSSQASREFEVDLIMARVQDLNRLDEIEDRLARLESKN